MINKKRLASLAMVPIATILAATTVFASDGFKIKWDDFKHGFSVGAPGSDAVGNQHKWDRLGPEKIIMKSCVGAP